MAAITFTNAAADELTKRLGEIQPGYCGTLHGYCLRLLQRHGSLIGLPDKLTVLDEEQTERLVKQIITEVNYKGALGSVQDAISEGPRKCPPGHHLSNAEVVSSRFYSKLRASGLLTFDSILHYTSKLLQENGAAVQGWTHLFVDETQDASDLDFAIYRALPVQHRFYVGDPDQSIYEWRGGSIDNILALDGEAGVEKVNLELNYRSDGKICAVAQKLIEHNAGRIKKKTLSMSGADGRVFVDQYQSEFDEIQHVAQEIKTTSNASECAVLLRTNKLVDQYRLGLVSYGIQVVTREHQQRPQDWAACKALLSLLNAPQSDLLAEWYLSLTRGEKAAQAAKLAAAAAGVTINDQGLGIPEGIEPCDVPVILAKAGIGQESIAVVAASVQALGPSDGMPELLLALAQEPENEEHGHGVTVTTMHSAKGREWDRVWLPAFEQGTIPSNSAVKGDAVEQERRLAFVAITRARHACYLSHVKERRPPFSRGPVLTNPSQFIGEAGL